MVLLSLPRVRPRSLWCTVVHGLASFPLTIRKDPISSTLMTQRRCSRSIRSPGNRVAPAVPSKRPALRPLSIFFTQDWGPPLSLSQVQLCFALTPTSVSWRSARTLRARSFPILPTWSPLLPALLRALKTLFFLSFPSPHVFPPLHWSLGDQGSLLPCPRDTLKVWTLGAHIQT